MSLPSTNDNNELDDESQISWKEGYIHSDPFEDRVVVLSKKNERQGSGTALIAWAKISMEVHLVDDLKANILVRTSVLNTRGIS